MYTTHLAIWRLLLGPLNLSHFVEDQNDPSTSQILSSWPSVQWWGRAPPVRSTPPVQRHSADEPALSGNLNQAVMVHKSINNGCCQSLVNKNLAPLRNWPV